MQENTGSCVDCTNSIGGLPPWDGTLIIPTADGYDATASIRESQDYVPGDAAVSINSIDASVELRYVGGSECWIMAVLCGSGTIRNVWTGKKSTGSTFAGTYTRISGCDMTATVIVA
jgi:hypothetical protein